MIRISLGDIYDLGQEFFRWEIATAVAGSIIGIDAFNQPDVEASQVETRKLTSEYEKTGSLPSEKAIFEQMESSFSPIPKMRRRSWRQGARSWTSCAHI